MNQKQIWNRAYKNSLTWKKETLELPNLLKEKKVLELGVGSGKTLISILKQDPKSVTALDFSAEAIKIGKKQFKDHRIKFLTKDFLEFKSQEKYDVIICYFFLNNFLEKDRKKAVNKMKSLLSPGGIILFEDFLEGDYRQMGKEIEKNTIKKKSGMICHFFSEIELKSLFQEFKIKTKVRVSSPIKSNKNARRKIISAIITNAPDRI